MIEEGRDLTTLEYIVLGLISMGPQSGYSIVSQFEENNSIWSASPGSIYPMLKRLEKQKVIAGQLEMEHEARPRKVYTLTPLGEGLLDEWLRVIPAMRPFYEQREVAMWRFQFMERRFSLPQVIAWLEGYLDSVRYASAVQEVYHRGITAAWEEIGEVSIHRQLAMEAYVMEQNAIRTWIEMALMRLRSIGYQTGEFRQVDGG